MGKIKILVVDDEEEICQLVRSFLIKRNCNVFTATTGKEAIRLVNKGHPQIVLLDVRLGSESGMDILSKIKEIDKNIKVIMVTALNDEESVKEATSLGADSYITKPFTTNYLNDIILQKISQALPAQAECLNKEKPGFFSFFKKIAS